MTSRARSKERLSKVFLDDDPVTLTGDEALPPLSRIVRAGGKLPDRVDVLYLRSPTDLHGHPLDADEVIDRTAEPTRPIYLRTVPRASKPIATAQPGHPLSWPDPTATRAPVAMPNLDPVIAQLGKERPRPPHEQAVFRSPSQVDAALAAASAKPSPAARRAESLAAAEAEAEQRQEDERNQEDTLQDDQEAREDAADDASDQH